MRVVHILVALTLPLGSALSAEWTPTRGPVAGADVRKAYADSQQVMVASATTAFLSEDEAVTWNPIYPHLPRGFRISTLSAIGRTLLFGDSQGRIVRSLDRGETWEESPTKLPGQVGVLFTTGPYAFAGSRGAFRSTDSGRTWSPTIPALENLDVYSFARFHGTLCMGTSEGLYRSDDMGMHWAKVDIGYPVRYVFLVFILGERIFLQDYNSFWSTADSGRTWAKFKTIINVFKAVQMAPVGRSQLYASFYRSPFNDLPSVHHSDDFGLSWHRVIEGLPAAVDIPALVTDGKRLYATAPPYGVYRSKADQKGWEAANQGMGMSYVRHLSASGERILAVTDTTYRNGPIPYGGIQASDDSGDTWVPANAGFQDLQINTLLAHRGELLAGTEKGPGLYRSRDHGATWHGDLRSMDFRIGALAAEGDAYFAWSYLDKKFYRSYDRGESWSKSSQGLDLQTNSAFFAWNGDLYAGNFCNDAFRSSDGGESWILVDSTLKDQYGVCSTVNGFAGLGQDVFLVMKSRDPGRWEDAVFRTSDRGGTWTRFWTPLGSVKIIRTFGNRLFIGGIGGVAYSDDHGATWQRLGQTLQDWEEVVDIAENSTHYFAAVFGEGVWRIPK